MPPEPTDPTQSPEAPEGEITPGAQADLTGQGQDLPEGGQEQQQHIDRLKQQLKGKETQAEELKTELQQMKTEKQITSFQAQQQSAPVYQQPQQQQPTMDPETFLTAEEMQQKMKAYEDLDGAEIERLNAVSGNRRTTHATGTLLQNLGAAARLQGSTNAVVNDCTSAPEWQDDTIRQQIIVDTIAAQQNPATAGRYAQGQMQVEGVGVLNPNIILDKIKDYRIRAGGAVKQTEAGLRPEGHDVLREEGPGSALPGPGDTFDASRLLTGSERSLVQKGMNMKGTPFSNLTDIQEGYRKLWKGLGAEERETRKADGAPVRNEEKSRAGTIWKSKG